MSRAGDEHAPRAQTCYLVWTHRDPPQVMRLLKRLRSLSPSSTIVVHHDPRGEALDEDAVRALGGDTRVILADAPMRWGDMSLVHALIHCLRWVEANVDYEWLVHMSGQDYPLRPLSELEAKLAAEQMDAYVVARRLGTREEVDLSKESVRRYFYRHYQLPRFIRPPGRRAARPETGPARAAGAAASAPGAATPAPGRRRRPLVNVKVMARGEGVRVGLPARRTPFTEDFPCWKGSLWVMLSRRAVRHYLATVDARPDLVDYYSRTIIPDESMTATILANAPGLAVCPDPLRFTSWSGRPHPDTIRADHLPAAFASGAYFARKFSDEDPLVYDAIDAHLDTLEERPDAEGSRDTAQ